MSRPQPLDWLILGFLVIAWGSAFAFLKIAVEHFSPSWNTAIRLWVAVATLAAVMALRGQGLPGLRDPAWRFYAVIGPLGLALPFALYAFSAERLPSALNAMSNGSTPLFTAILAHLFLADDRLTPRRVAGIGLGFVGVGVLVAPGLGQGVGFQAIGLAAALAGAALYGASNVAIKRAPAVPATAGAMMMCLCAAIAATAGALATGPTPGVPPLRSLLAVVAQGMLPTALGSIGYVFLVQRRGPVFLSMSVYLAPIWAALVGVVFLAERIEWTAFAALGLILGGVGLATTGPGPRPPAAPAKPGAR